jgi:hypothetical protein
MRTFIQLKDSVGFATVNTSGETDGIEVEPGTGDQYIGQLYSNGEWSAAPIINYAILDQQGNIIELRSTQFPLDRGSWPEWNNEIPTNWRWVDGSWVDPNPIIETPVAEETPEDPA